jgi:ABC-2 type transport system ATP-binding protein
VVAQPVIELNGLGKRYWKLHERAKLSQSVLPFVRPKREELWALRDISLTVAAGETLGVLGHNGAGKTTLLRLLAGVTNPTEGRTRVVGRIAPLISLGVGFHQEMSGRENVLVNGMLLGLSAKQVQERFESIVEFAELEEFIDTPVKFYSSGMFMRLGFAIVVHVDPTILLVDEILAVGDASFQLKCFERLRQLRDQGAAIVVVSHSLHTIRLLCRRAVLISRGRMIYDGDVERAIALHFQSVSRVSSGDGARSGVEVLERRLEGDIGDGHHANYDDPLALVLRLHFHEGVASVELTLTIETDMGYPVTIDASRVEAPAEGFRAGEQAELRVSFRARLGGGSYRLAIAFRGADGAALGASDGLMLFVAARPSSLGVVELCAEFEVDGVDRTDYRSMILDA